MDILFVDWSSYHHSLDYGQYRKQASVARAENVAYFEVHTQTLHFASEASWQLDVVIYGIGNVDAPDHNILNHQTAGWDTDRIQNGLDIDTVVVVVVVVVVVLVDAADDDAAAVVAVDIAPPVLDAWLLVHNHCCCRLLEILHWSEFHNRLY